jgi:methylated-DNA-[protein]-cysteine S-methyltransferase
MTSSIYYKSPIGLLQLVFNNNKLTSIHIDGIEELETAIEEMSSIQQGVIKQLKSYFKGELQEFDIEMEFLKGTDFEQTIWKELFTIPYGKLITYSDLAFQIGKTKGASQAVGKALGNNPIGIIVPCHRVIGKNGKLTGYASGLHRKAFLLELEQKHTIGVQGKLF